MALRSFGGFFRDAPWDPCDRRVRFKLPGRFKELKGEVDDGLGLFDDDGVAGALDDLELGAGDGFGESPAALERG